VLSDQIRVYDELRQRCPVARSDYLGWSLFRHDDVLRVLMDPESFSNAVSKHASVPNGMDPPRHTAYRRLIEPYFAADRIEQFEPVCRSLAVQLAEGLPPDGEIEFMSQFAQDFALEIQCAFMGWPGDLHQPLRQWTRRNHDATLSADRERTAAVAFEFDHQIRQLLEARRKIEHGANDGAPPDVTSRLMRDELDGRRLSDEEIVSIVRNWTVGELATIAASVGILAAYLAAHQELQAMMRSQPSLLPQAIDEILRIDAPLIANSRRARRPVAIGGREIDSGERVTVIWASANRDERVFGSPDEFRLDRLPDANLLYGAGIHICPGAPLARLELRIIMEELLAHTVNLAPACDKSPVRAGYPAGGFSSLPLRVRRAAMAD
jgi:cytochrome P450